MSTGAYLEHLTADDVALVSRVGLVRAEHLRARPNEVERLLGSDAVFDAVLGPSAEPALLRASPFLTFAVAVHRTAHDLETASYIEEWTGARKRLPVFDTAALKDFVDDPVRRLFLVELLASYTHLSSGAFWFRQGRRWRRRRFSELDPVRMAAMLDVVPDDQRAGVYRRLGDLSLFLTGVFPDHTDRRLFEPFATARLLRSAGFSGEDADRGAVALLEALGARWYRLAAQSAGPVLAGTARVLGDVAQRFRHARRVLNLVTDRYLFGFRDGWFSASDA